MGILADLRLRSSGLLVVPGMSISQTHRSIPNDNYVAANATRLLFVNSSLPGDILGGTSASYLVEPGEVCGSRQYGSRLSYFPVFLRASNALMSSSVIVMSCWSA